MQRAGYRTGQIGKYHVAPEEVYHFEQYIKGPSPAEMADRCRELIAAESDKPFFLYCPWTPPHAAYQIPED